MEVIPDGFRSIAIKNMCEKSNLKLFKVPCLLDILCFRRFTGKLMHPHQKCKQPLEQGVL